MSEIEVSGLSKYFGAVKVFEELSLQVHEGEFLSLLGPSGCGKTTVLRCIAGLEEPTSGRISIGGGSVVDTTSNLMIPPNKRGLGMVFQSYALWPHMNVFSNVAYALKLQRRPASEVKKKVAESLELVGLSHLSARAIGELSGGQQQRVALARALAAEPRVLLLDEPLSNLDAAMRAHMRRELRRIHQQVRRTSIYVTHDQLEAVTLSDRIVVMNAGQIEQVGTPEEVFGTPENRWVAEFVGFDNFVEAELISVGDDHAVAHPVGWPDPIVCKISKSFRSAGGPARFTVATRSSSFEAGQSEASTPLVAAIQEATYVGDTTEYLLNAYGAKLLCRLPAHGTPASGGQTQLNLYLPHMAAVALAA